MAVSSAHVDGLNDTYITILSVIIGLSTIVLGLRYYVKLNIDKQLALEDWILAPAQILNIASSVLWMLVPPDERAVCSASRVGGNVDCALVSCSSSSVAMSPLTGWRGLHESHDDMHVFQAMREMRPSHRADSNDTKDLAKMERIRHCDSVRRASHLDIYSADPQLRSCDQQG